MNLLAERKQKSTVKKEKKKTNQKPKTIQPETQMLPAWVLHLYSKPFKPIGKNLVLVTSNNTLSPNPRSICQSVTSLSELRQITPHAISDQNRPRIWRILANIIPLASTSELGILNKKRNEYQEYAFRSNEEEIVRDNDPLLIETLKLIKKDVLRTLPESAVFRNRFVQAALTRLLLTYSVR